MTKKVKSKEKSKKIEKKEIKDVISKSPINRFNIILVDIQVLLTMLVIILFIVCLFNRKYLIWVELSLSLALFCMAYNNFKIYRRKFATVLYLLVALVLLVLFVLRIFGVTV